MAVKGSALSTGLTTQPLAFWGDMGNVACSKPWRHMDNPPRATLYAKGDSPCYFALCDSCALESSARDGLVEPLERLRARLLHDLMAGRG